ncbi:MAG TPA: FkbM family methyltransferase [Stellaceae bacterium]|nr:FkbM family methyltransferase [Stellaceae bacterium]
MAPPLRIEIAAPLARSLAAAGGKPRGLARIGHKLRKALFFTLHQRLGLPAPARIHLRDGSSFAVDCGNTAFLQLAKSLAAGGYEPEVTALAERLAPFIGTAYDIGANWGYLSLVLATAPGFHGHVHAFEIDPRTSADLARTIERAGIADRVSGHPFGLSDHDGTARLSRSRHSFLTQISETDGNRVAVRQLDALALPPPDLIKLDVEGHEAAVLRGGVRMLETARPLIVFESWWRDGVAAPETLELLEHHGFALHRLVALEGNVRAEPLTAAERAAVPETLNLLAVPPQRREWLERVGIV